LGSIPNNNELVIVVRKGEIVMLNVSAALRRAMECNQTRTAIIAGDIELTYEEAWKRGCQLANAFLEMGLKRQIFFLPQQLVILYVFLYTVVILH
jgi:non-ribosomal peptide synthetase component E (peptide arylation enzyme)